MGDPQPPRESVMSRRRFLAGVGAGIGDLAVEGASGSVSQKVDVSERQAVAVATRRAICGEVPAGLPLPRRIESEPADSPVSIIEMQHTDKDGRKYFLAGLRLDYNKLGLLNKDNPILELYIMSSDGTEVLRYFSLSSIHSIIMLTRNRFTVPAEGDEVFGYIPVAESAYIWRALTSGGDSEGILGCGEPGKIPETSLAITVTTGSRHLALKDGGIRVVNGENVVQTDYNISGFGDTVIAIEAMNRSRMEELLEMQHV